MKTAALYTFLLSLMLLGSCGKTDPNRPVIPYTPVNRQIDMNLPQYMPLQQNGGFIYLDGEGAKGIIVVNHNSNYMAIERTCTYQQGSDCQRVSMDNSRFFIACGYYEGSDWHSCCGSKSHLDGTIMEGPAIYPLLTYQVMRNGSVLHITN